MPNKQWFLTFSDGSWELRAAGQRIAAEARQTGLFDRVHCFDFTQLKSRFPKFWQAHCDFILSNSRGAGYWLWKPFLIDAILKEMKQGDILFYCDAGCEIDARLNKSFYKIDPITNDADVSLVIVDGRICEKWTNSYTINNLNATKQILKKEQTAGTLIVCRKNDRCQALIREWLDRCVSYGYGLLVDRNDLELNMFEEHRHDQSILSIVAYSALASKEIKANLLSCDFFETDGSGLRALRNKTGYRIADQNRLIVKAARKSRRLIERWLDLEARRIKKLRS